MSCLFFFQYRSTVWTTGCLDADFTLAKWTCLVVGSAGASSFLLKESNLLIPFIRQNKIFTQGKCFEFFHKFFHDESSPLYFTLYTNILYSGRRFHWRYWTYRCKRLYQMSCHPYVKRSGSGYHCHECTEKSCKSLPGKRNYYGIFPCEWTADACHWIWFSAKNKNPERMPIV